MRTRIVLKEKNLPFERILMDLPNQEQKEPWYLTLNPYGKVPLLVEKVAQGGSYMEHIGNAFGPDEATWRDASPVTHAKSAGTGPPFLFAAYEKGNPAHQAQERLAGLIRGAKGKAEVVLLEGRTHTTANHLLGAPGDETGKVLLRFVREVTK